MARNYYNLYKALGPKIFWTSFILILLSCFFVLFVLINVSNDWKFWKDVFTNLGTSLNEDIFLEIFKLCAFVGILIVVVFQYKSLKKDKQYSFVTGRLQKHTPDGRREATDVTVKLIFIKALLYVAIVLCPIFVIPVLLCWRTYVKNYLSSDDFVCLKNKIDKNTKEWNKLNEHVDDLRNSFDDYSKKYHGTSSFVDKSKYNYSRRYLMDHSSDPYTYSCSLQVMRNSCNKPFWYLCKYFNFKKDEETLNKVEKALNDYASAEQGKEILLNERETLLMDIYFEIPFLIRRYKKLLLFDSLGFDLLDKDLVYYPVFVFDYVSAGGNSHQSNEIVLDVHGMETFASWLEDEIKFKKSVKAQRSLMTQQLREHIKNRDNFTCQNCGNSVSKEPNLLLEIDHILPISKGGITTEDNLQTLCWKCNRAKGAKVD